jgi:hypothetical protein
MSSSTAHVLSATAMSYGVATALSGLLQLRAMLARRASCGVSARFFAAYAGGHAIWLLDGLGAGSPPLIVVDAVGLLCGGLTLGVALALRGSPLHPSSWTSCPATPNLTKVRAPGRAGATPTIASGRTRATHDLDIATDIARGRSRADRVSRPMQ